MNGDKAETLLNDAVEAMHALNATREKLSKLSPNGRNYYTQVDRAMTDAVEQFRAMLKRFDSVLDEVERYAEAVADGGAK